MFKCLNESCDFSIRRVNRTTTYQVCGTHNHWFSGVNHNNQLIRLIYKRSFIINKLNSLILCAHPISTLWLKIINKLYFWSILAGSVYNKCIKFRQEFIVKFGCFNQLWCVLNFEQRKWYFFSLCWLHFD